ncbi:MAG: hypothetical protein HDR88_14800 [Bacteroides sp.]|nr:hypothetical protein [Bacteroides sp.]
MGKLEYNVEASMITPTTAVVTVTIPQGTNNLFKIQDNGYYYGYHNIYLVDREYKYPQQVEYYNSHLISGQEFESDTESTRLCLFSELTPNTTYYVIIEPSLDLNDNSSREYYWKNTKYVYTGYSFTTAESGDYSSVGKASCELVEALQGVTQVRFNLHENIYFINYADYTVSASTSSDMSNPITATYHSYSDNDLFSTFTCNFPDLQKTKYYFQISGEFFLKYLDFDNYSDYYNERIDLTLKIEEPIDLSEVVYQQAIAETYFIGRDFNIFRFNLPKDINYSSQWSVKWGLSQDNIDSEIIKDYFSSSESLCYTYIPLSFNEGEKIYFQLSGEYSFNGNYNSILFDSEINYNPHKRIIPDPEFITIFNGNDYCIGKISIPTQEILNNNSLSTYYIGDEENFSDSDTMSFQDNFSDNCYLYFINPDPSIPHYLCVKSNFYFPLSYHNFSFDGVIDIANRIDPAPKDVYLYNVDLEEQEDGSVKVSLNCNEMFSFTNLDYHTKLTVSQDYSGSDYDKFSVYDFSSTSNTIEFIIDASKMSTLQQGIEYKLSFKNFSLQYEDKTLGSWDSYWLWTPYPSESGEMKTPKLIRANDSTGAGSSNVVTR